MSGLLPSGFRSDSKTNVKNSRKVPKTGLTFHYIAVLVKIKLGSLFECLQDGGGGDEPLGSFWGPFGSLFGLCGYKNLNF